MRLGFDLSLNSNNSLLQWGFMNDALAGIDGVPSNVLNSWAKICFEFNTMLNNQGLFEKHEIASACLEELIEIHDLYPALIEGGDIREFQIVELHILEGT